MKFLIVFVALCAVALAAPVADVETVKQESEVGPISYKYIYETSDGSKQFADGVVKNIGTEHEGIAVHGFYSYVGDDGVTYTVHYVADEFGFQPHGDHLPVAPVA